MSQEGETSSEPVGTDATHGDLFGTPTVNPQIQGKDMNDLFVGRLGRREQVGKCSQSALKSALRNPGALGSEECSRGWSSCYPLHREHPNF